jgi:HD-like signal output (HDOD) protein/CheY-like chemotaxis protein
MKRIVFVDDEVRILEGLRRLMRSLRHEWDMEFYDSPLAALEQFETAPADVVVSDIRMPAMDGAEFLTEVQKRWPATIRIVLSGQCDRDVVFRAVRPSHQFLTKPCNPDLLRSTLARLKELRERVINDNIRSQISAITSLPVAGSNYHKLVNLLSSGNPSINDVAEIMASDVGLAAKVMQLVSSNFFGTQQPLCMPFQAVQRLGIEVIRSLVLECDLFSPNTFEPELTPWVEFYEKLCLAIALAAQRIAEHETQDESVIVTSYLAGLFAKIGIAIFVSVDAAKYRQILRLAFEETSRLMDVEHQNYGVTRNEAGAYLLALWGLPSSVVEPIIYPDVPAKSQESAFGPVTAVHVAQRFVAEGLELTRNLAWPLDEEFLKSIGRYNQLDDWRKICLQTVREYFAQFDMAMAELQPTVQTQCRQNEAAIENR